MSSAQPEILRVPALRAHADHLRQLHVELSSLSPVGRYLIYDDDAFVDYLESVLDDPSHLFTQTADGEAFSHLRVIGDVIFLNNIFVTERSRGYGVGRALLRESIRSLRGEQQQFMELDAFASNPLAVGWYARLGFAEQSRVNWLDLGKPRKAISNAAFTPDQNGFTQILADGARAGTLVGSRALLSDVSAFYLLGNDRVASAVARVSDDRGGSESPVLETSLRLRAPIETVLEKLHS